MGFLNALFGRTVAEKRHNLVLTAYITMAFILLLSVLLTVSLFVGGDNDRKEEEDSPASDVPSSRIVEYDYTETKKGSLLVINKSTAAYDFTLNPESDLVKISDKIPSHNGTPVYSLRSDTALANAEALDALNRMISDYFEKNPDTAKKLTVRTAYRSYAAQEALNSSVGAGHSDFHTGMLFELTPEGSAASISLDTAYSWIYENAHKYGFIERYPEAKSSSTGISDFDNAFRYVGEAHATYMKANGLCLEEYVAHLQQNEGKTLSVGSFKISYAKANNGGTTKINLPSRTAKVSGDNMGGFVISSK